MNYDDLDVDQQAAVELIQKAAIGVITGGPGTGKTTCLRVALDMLNVRSTYIGWEFGDTIFPRVVLCAPTGKAARRMSEATGRSAVTIHRLLGYKGSAFDFCEEHPILGVQLVVVDEASMVDTELAAALLSALPSQTRIIFVGDADQLPSVGPGRVLFDLIESNAVPKVQLRTLHRAAQESWICRNAQTLIREGCLELEGDFKDFFLATHPDPAAIANLIVQNVEANQGEDMQILVPQRRGAVGLHRLNLLIQQAVCPGLGGAHVVLHKDDKDHPGGVRVHVGDKVVNKKNNYQKVVMNGEIGIVENVTAKGKRSVTIRFEGHDELTQLEGDELFALELAYAITIHSAQGSEWPLVFVVAHSEHSFMLTRRLLYTAITRAKKDVWIFGDEKGLYKAMRDTRENKRVTRLQEKIDVVLGAEALR